MSTHPRSPAIDAMMRALDAATQLETVAGGPALLTEAPGGEAAPRTKSEPVPKARAAKGAGDHAGPDDETMAAAGRG